MPTLEGVKPKNLLDGSIYTARDINKVDKLLESNANLPHRRYMLPKKTLPRGRKPLLLRSENPKHPLEG